MKYKKLKLVLAVLLAGAMTIPSTLGGVIVRGTYDNFFLGLPDGADGIEAVIEAGDFARDSTGSFAEELTEFFDNRQGGVNSDDCCDNFGSMVRGFIEAPQTGTYTIVVSSDDDSELYINTSSTPHTVIPMRDPQYLIGFEDDWTNGDPFTAARFDQRSSVVELVKGTKYYVELFHREGGGGSFINVSWERPDGVRETIPGVALAPLGSSGDPFVLATSTEIALQPANVAVSESEEALFFVTVHAPQPTQFQWLQNGTPIDGANLSWYSIPEAQLSQSGNTFSVRITNGSGQTTTSSGATLTVAADSEPPTITSVAGSGNPHGLIVQYSEKVTEASATNAANYLISGQSVSIAGITMLSTSSVLIDIGEYSDEPLSVRVSGVQDRSSRANAIATTNYDVNFNLKGATYLFYEYPGGGLGGFYPAPRGVGEFPANPNPFDPGIQGNAGNGFSSRASSSTPYLEVPNSGDIATNPPGDVANNYGLVVYGYLIPQETATYFFYLAVDDNAELYVSTNEDPANTTLIAREPQWNGIREWNGTADIATTAEVETNINHSGPVSLVAGQRYYYEVISQEGGGGDNVAVAWNTSGTPPTNGAQPIGADFLEQAVNFGSLSIASHPQNQDGIEGLPVSFSITIEGSDSLALGYQWYRNGNPIIGANLPSLSIDPVALSDDGAVLHVEAFNSNGTFNRVVSDPATLSVDNDVFPPGVVSISSSPLLETVIIVFDEVIDVDSAQTAGNYTITPIGGGAALAVNSASLLANGTTVRLSTATQAEGTKYSVQLSGIVDRAASRNTLNGTFSFVSHALQAGGLTALFYEGGGGLGFYPGPGMNFFPDNYSAFGPQAPGAGNQQLVVNGQSSSTPYFESPSSGTITTNPANARDGYSQVLFGWLQPEVTGTYQFYLASDDQAGLYLSTNDNPANSRQIAAENDWSSIRTWSNRVPDPDNNPFDSVGNPTGATSPLINLVAGQRYYIEAINSEGGGGDNLAVAWAFTTDGSTPTRPANGTPPIPGNVLYSRLAVSDELVVTSSSPADGATGVFIDTDTVSVTIKDGFSSKVDPNNISATLGGQAVTVSAQKSGDDTVITATLPDVLAANTTLDLVVTVTTTDGEAISITRSFTTENIAVLNAGWKTASGTGTGSGFTVRTEQADAAAGLANTWDRAEAQLKGTPASVFSGGPVDLPVINLNQSAADSGSIGGDESFQSHGLMQGLGDNAAGNNTDMISGEFITYLEFPAPGLYFMGINSDDGFRITSGLDPVDPADADASDSVFVGGFNAGRGTSAATPQSPVRAMVEEAGVYAFRMVWFEGTGGANVEWTVQNPAGNWVLLNSDDSHVKAFTGRSVEPGGTVIPSDGAVLAIEDGSGNVIISWEPVGGTLQWAPAVTGPWENVAGATSPHTSTVDTGNKFYRVVQ